MAVCSVCRVCQCLQLAPHGGSFQFSVGQALSRCRFAAGMRRLVCPPARFRHDDALLFSVFQAFQCTGRIEDVRRKAWHWRPDPSMCALVKVKSVEFVWTDFAMWRQAQFCLARRGVCVALKFAC